MKAVPVSDVKKSGKKVAVSKTFSAKVKKASVPAKTEKSTVKTVKKSASAKAEKTAVKKVSDSAKSEAPVKQRTELHIKKVKLSKADKKFFRDLLMKERAKFGQLLKFHADEALTSRKDSGAGRAGMATHMADLGSDNFRHDFELGLLSGEADVMEMIDEALQKLEDSEYGVCLDCGQMIPRARLEAKPYARYCTKCKSLRENTEDGFRRR